MLKYGDRNSVWNGEAKQTRGGLTKDDLIKSRSGKIVSKRKSESARALYQKNGGFRNKVVPQTPEPVKRDLVEPPKKRRRRKKKVSKD